MRFISRHGSKHIPKVVAKGGLAFTGLCWLFRTSTRSYASQGLMLKEGLAFTGELAMLVKVLCCLSGTKRIDCSSCIL